MPRCFFELFDFGNFEIPFPRNAANSSLPSPQGFCDICHVERRERSAVWFASQPLIAATARPQPAVSGTTAATPGLRVQQWRVWPLARARLRRAVRSGGCRMDATNAREHAYGWWSRTALWESSHATAGRLSCSTRCFSLRTVPIASCGRPGCEWDPIMVERRVSRTETQRACVFRGTGRTNR